MNQGLVAEQYQQHSRHICSSSSSSVMIPTSASIKWALAGSYAADCQSTPYALRHWRQRKLCHCGKRVKPRWQFFWWTGAGWMRYPRAIEDLMEQNDAILIGLRYAMPLHDCADHFARNNWRISGLLSITTWLLHETAGWLEDYFKTTGTPQAMGWLTSSRYSATKSARCSRCDDNGDSIISDVTETPILEECCRSSVVGSAVLLSVHRLWRKELISTNYQYLDEGADFIIIVNSKNKEAAI